MTKSLGVYTVIAILISTPFVLANIYLGYIMGGPPEFAALIVTVIFIICWIYFSNTMGRRHRKGFALFITIYWLLALFMYTLTIYAAELYNSVLIIPLIFFISPLYGVRFYMSYHDSIFLGIPIIICLLLISYILGKNSSKYNQINNGNIE